MKIPFAVKIALLVMLLTASISGVALSVFYHYSAAALVEEMQGRLQDLAHTGAHLFREQDRELIALMHEFLLEETEPRTRALLDIPESGTNESLPPERSKALHNTEEFQYLVQLLRQIKRASSPRVEGLRLLEQDDGQGDEPPNIFWAYLMVSVPEAPEHDVVMFLADSNYSEMDYDGNGVIHETEAGNPIGNLYAGDPEIFGLPFSTGEMTVSEGWYTDRWGTFMTAVVPIKDADGKVIAALGLDYLVTHQFLKLKQIMLICFYIFGASQVIALLFSLLLAYMINRPLTRLRLGAERIRQRNFGHRVDVRSNDEFGLLADTLTAMALEMRDYQAGLETLVEQRTGELEEANREVLKLYESTRQENQSLGQELDVARRLQVGMVPGPDQLRRIDGLDAAVLMQPAPQMSGDYLDVLPDGQGSFVFVLGSVSGHGLDTGLHMLMARTALRVFWQKPRETLEQTCQAFNRLLLDQFSQARDDRHMTATLARFDGRDSFTVVGQNQDILVARGEGNVELVDTVSLGVPLGVREDISEQLHSLQIRLDPGQVMVLCSDGLLAAENADGALFGVERLQAVMAQSWRNSAAVIRDRIREAVAAFQGELAATDDISLLVIKRKQQ